MCRVIWFICCVVYALRPCIGSAQPRRPPAGSPPRSALVSPASARVLLQQKPTYDLEPFFLQDSTYLEAYRSFKRGAYRAAARGFLAVRRHGPSGLRKRAAYMLALSYRKSGRRLEAARVLQTIADYDQLASHIAMRLGSYFHRTGDQQGALKHLADVEPGTLYYAEARLTMANILMRQSKYARAATLLHQCLGSAQTTRSRCRLRRVLADVETKLSKPKQAQRNLWLVWERCANEKQSRRIKRQLKALKHNITFAHELVRSVVQANPKELRKIKRRLRRLKRKHRRGLGRAAVLMAQGWIHRNSPKTRELARQEFAQAYRLAQKDSWIRAWILQGWASALRRDNMDVEAADKYAEIASLVPKHPLAARALLEAGRLLALRGKELEARDHWQKLTQRQSLPNVQAKACWELAWSHYVGGQWREAIRWLDALSERFGTLKSPSGSLWSEQAGYWKAKALAKLGGEREAKQLLLHLVNKGTLTFYSNLAFARLQEMSEGNVSSLRPRHHLKATSRANLLEMQNLSIAVYPGLDTPVELIRLGLYDRAYQELDLLARQRQLPTDALLLLAALLIRRTNHWKAQRILRHRPLFQMLSHPPALRMWQLAYPLRYFEHIKQVTRENSFCPFLLASLIKHESGFNRNAVSRSEAVGLTQLLPATARATARLMGIRRPSIRRLKRSKLNIRIGARYLRELLNLFGENTALALAAYNSGPGAMKTWWKRWKHMETDEFLEMLPYSSAYAQKILTTWTVYRYLYGNPQDKLMRNFLFSFSLPAQLGPFMQPAAKTARGAQPRR